MKLEELEPRIVRITFDLPLGIDHVHCYALGDGDGRWTIVDTGLGLPDAEARWRSALGRLQGDVARIVITHFHPDHVGASALLARVTSAPVHQGALDHEQCVRTWGSRRDLERLVAYWREHGLPREHLDGFPAESARLAGWVEAVQHPAPLEPGTTVDGWQVLHLPGHADGHLCLMRDGVLVAGDALLSTISPNVGLYPDSRPDPLGDYLGSLERIAELEPRVAYAGHGATIDDPAGRARELVAHHVRRLEETLAALDSEPRTAYELSLALFPGELPSVLRRFALAETCAHLEHLRLRGAVALSSSDGVVRYASPA